MSGEFLIEEYIEGQEFSVELFLLDNEIKWGSVTEKRSGRLPYFVEIGHTVPTSVYKDKIGVLIQAATKSVIALGYTSGPFHVEMRYSAKGYPVIMEVNARTGGDFIYTDLLINAFGVNIYDASLDYHLGIPVTIKATKAQASSVAFLTLEQEGTIESISGVEKLSTHHNVVKSHIDLKPGMNVSFAKGIKERYGYVITIANTAEEAKVSALKALESIYIKIR